MKKIFSLTLLAFLLAGCGATEAPEGEPAEVVDGSVLKSLDSGVTFLPKASVNDNTLLTGIDILSLAFHPTNPEIMYVGTLKNGIYRTTNKGDMWEPIFFPPEKVYSLVVDPTNGDYLYATGVYESISKLYVSKNAGTDWEELYTEPGKGSVLTVIAIDPTNAQHILMGTSKGIINESYDGGVSWTNVTSFEEAVTQIVFIEKAPGTVLALVQGQQIVLSRDNGKTWPQKEVGTFALPPLGNNPAVQENTEATADPNNQNTVVVDQFLPGTLYTGTNDGVFKSEDFGETWKPLNILESSKQFPIKAIAVNPKKSNEIVYVSGRAFYKSKDGGTSWSTSKLSIERPVNMVHYEPREGLELYLTLRK